MSLANNLALQGGVLNCTETIIKTKDWVDLNAEVTKLASGQTGYGTFEGTSQSGIGRNWNVEYETSQASVNFTPTKSGTYTIKARVMIVPTNDDASPAVNIDTAGRVLSFAVWNMTTDTIVNGGTEAKGSLGGDAIFQQGVADTDDRQYYVDLGSGISLTAGVEYNVGIQYRGASAPVVGTNGGVVCYFTLDGPLP